MKLIIAEDEMLCREHLASIEWDRMGVRLAGIAENGAEALELAKQIKPDIIISDIKMPKMSGMELAETLAVILPETRIIILTAYTNFEYVQESVSLSVFEYILKPFEDETLIASVEKAINEIKSEKERKLQMESIERQLDHSKYFLKSYFFDSGLSAAVRGSEFSSIFGNLNPNGKYVAVTVSIAQNSSENMFSSNYDLFQTILDILKKRSMNVIPFFEISFFTFLFSFDSEMPVSKINNVIFDSADSISRHIDFQDGIKYVIGIGKCVNSLENAALSYEGAVNALEYSFYLGFNTVIFIGDVEPKNDCKTHINVYVSDFLSHVKVGNFEAAHIQLKKIFNSFRYSCEDIAVVQRTCNDIISQLSLCLVQCGINPDTLFNKTDSWSVIRQYHTIDELEKFLCDTANVTVAHINFTRKGDNENLIKQVQKYIQQNPATSLNDIAEHFYHSPNYLSSIFSKETDTTIKNYIIQIRIETAQKLLRETNDNIYKIANDVGYKNSQHFSMLFKNKVGVSPAEYRANIHKYTK